MRTMPRRIVYSPLMAINAVEKVTRNTPPTKVEGLLRVLTRIIRQGYDLPERKAKGYSDSWEYVLIELFRRKLG